MNGIEGHGDALTEIYCDSASDSGNCLGGGDWDGYGYGYGAASGDGFNPVSDCIGCGRGYSAGNDHDTEGSA